jgi:adenosine deaminase
MSRHRLPAWGAILALTFTVASFCAQSIHTALPYAVERRWSELRASPPELYAFLYEMPKGADLHNHLSGAVYAERYLQIAAQDHLCIDRQFLSLLRSVSGTCAAGEIDTARAESDSTLESEMVDSLSMRDFVPGAQSAHDHFFATFQKFGAVSKTHAGELLAAVVRRAADQNESYLELMALSGSGAVSQLGDRTGLEDFETTRKKLEEGGLAQLTEALRARVDQMDEARIQALGCREQPHSSACEVRVGYIFEVTRGSPKQQVFAQVMAGFALAASDPKVVAINLVQAEDGFVSMRDYHLQMQMVDYAHRVYPRVHIALHAGELTLGLVPPEGLHFHIREAVEIGHAERIGHGVDIMYENNASQLLREMRQRHVAVEINLTSNDEILGVRGDRHPFPVYRKYGVPTVLSTDDEGVSRTNLTEEFERAVLSYKLSYADVKELARNSLQYSFAPGASYWAGGNYKMAVAACQSGRHSGACREFLAGNDRARLEADLEDRFDKFERNAFR